MRVVLRSPARVVVVLVQGDHRVGHSGEQRIAGERSAGGRHGGLLSLPPRGLAREAKGENPTCDVFLTRSARSLAYDWGVFGSEADSAPL